MSLPARSLIRLACLVVITGCTAPAPPDPGIARVKEESAALRLQGLARLERVRAKAVQQDAIVGNEIHYATREDQPTRLIFKDCLIVFPQSGITAAGDECVLTNGIFTFTGRPVVRDATGLYLTTPAPSLPAGHAPPAEAVMALVPLGNRLYGLHCTNATQVLDEW